MTTLCIHALGQLQILRAQEPLHFSKKAQHLLCLLLLHIGEARERDLIAEQLWPMRPPGKARHCLSTTLWRLRQALESQPFSDQPYLQTGHSTLAFDANAPYWFDVEVFEQQASFGLGSSFPLEKCHLRALEDALNLYHGDFLEGCYEDWCLATRERLQLLLLRVLKRLLRHYRLCEAFETAISYGQRLLALDPLREDVHRELMRCYQDAGQRSLALEQFQCCREILRQEIHVEPMPETWQLYRQIRDGGGSGPFPEVPQDDSLSLQTVLAQFRRALDVMEYTWQALKVAVEAEETNESVQGGTLCSGDG